MPLKLQKPAGLCYNNGMKREDKSILTKKNILAAARRLYYTNGFNCTSFENIAKECGITSPLIAYHFGSKSNLGVEVFCTYSTQQVDTLAAKASACGFTDEAAVITAYLLQNIRYYNEDKNALSFIVQSYSGPSIKLTPGVKDFIGILQPIITNDNTRNNFYTAAQFASRGLITSYASGEIDCPQEEFDRLYLNTFFAIFQKEIDTEEMLRKAYEVISSLKIAYAENFIWL